MISSAWIAIVTALGGGFLTHGFHYLRNRKRDEDKAEIEKAKVEATAREAADKLMMEMWVQISKEQGEWRETLRNQIKILENQVKELLQDNAKLNHKVMELDVQNRDLAAENAELRADNERLEARVQELELEAKRGTKG